MDELNYIEINISDIGNEINMIIDVKGLFVITNQFKKNITKDKINDLLRIIRTWEEFYDYSYQLEPEKYLIRLISNNEEKTLKTNGIKPKNYNEFKMWVGELYE